MSRMKRSISLCLAGGLAMVVVACGGTAATPTAAIPTVAIPSVSIPSIGIPTVAIPSIAIPSIGIPSFSIPPLPSGLAIPTFHQAPDLETALPDQIRGVTLTKLSFTGDTFLGGGATTSKEFVALMAQFGKQPSDLGVAIASDATGGLKIQLVAFRLAGVDANQRLAGLIAASAGSGSAPPTTSTANVGGKAVTSVTDAKGVTSYFYPKGEIAYIVGATPDDGNALAADELAALP